MGNTAGAAGENTIGRDSISMGHAVLRIAGRMLETDRNWIEVRDLAPDTKYQYAVNVNRRRIGGGVVRTYPEHASKLAFFAIGDFGSGSAKQYDIAKAMWREYSKRAASDNPVRFVITTGDNIYADISHGKVILHSGDQDNDWDRKFFEPYHDLLRQIPFYPSLGNHDGNGSENRADLAAYLDNFFFPGNRPARWYTFSYGGLADFFALDSTSNSTGAYPQPVYLRGGEESQWLNRALPASRAPWKIPYFHHPPFNAGPLHPASYNDLRPWTGLFERTGVKVVFSGHEHNFQFSEDSDATGRIRYVVSGAGGELRPGDIQNRMSAAHIEGWAAQRHFLVVEMEDRTMRITPVSYERVVVRNASGGEIPMPLVVRLP